MLVVFTEDERLQAKIHTLAAKRTADARIFSQPDALLEALRPSITHAFIDLTASQSNAFSLCTRIKEQWPQVQIIGSTLGIDPASVQAAKLAGVDVLLQRYKFEELLRAAVSNMRSDDDPNVSVLSGDV
jgi:DNA-binding NarL/FixJ family response regulator